MGSLPCGKHFLYRELAKSLGIMPAEIPSLLSNFFGQKTNTKETLKVSGALTTVSEKWILLFEQTLREVYRDTPLPQKLFITADDDIVDWFSDIIIKKNFVELILSGGIFDVEKIDGSYLEGYLHRGMRVQTVDPFLGIESIYLKKLLHHAK